MHPIIAWRVTVQRYPCEACGALPGQTCTTSGGQSTYTPHAVRSAVASTYNWTDPDRLVDLDGWDART